MYAPAIAAHKELGSKSPLIGLRRVRACPLRTVRRASCRGSTTTPNTTDGGGHKSWAGAARSIAVDAAKMRCPDDAEGDTRPVADPGVVAKFHRCAQRQSSRTTSLFRARMPMVTPPSAALAASGTSPKLAAGAVGDGRQRRCRPSLQNVEDALLADVRVDVRLVDQDTRDWDQRRRRLAVN